MSPKLFHRGSRFEHLLLHLIQGNATDYLSSALAAGYFDQAHFINECRQFTGQSPGDILRREEMSKLLTSWMEFRCDRVTSFDVW